MAHLLGSFGAKTKAVISLISCRAQSSRHITNCLLPYVAKTSHNQRVSATLYRFRHRQYSTAPKKSDPLRILFCGSDEFSCASLKALHDEHLRNPDLIRSIDVVVRPGKRVGRGHKIVRDPPIRDLATSLNLPIHERDTFTKWDMPEEINLIIAVSFGLFVPPRLLRKAKYGGLNIHPSLLPDLRGPAPLQYALLAGHSLTGVSLQTLDDKAFDHGVVLSQTPSDPSDSNALHIPASTTTVADLQALVTPAAAKLLIDGLRANLHVPPHEERGWKPSADTQLLHAPKITSQDRQITLERLRSLDAETSTPDRRGLLARRQAAIGPLWFYARARTGNVKRVIVEAVEEVDGLSVANRPATLSSPTPTVTTTTPTSTTPTTTTTPAQRTYKIPFLEQADETAASTTLVFYDLDPDAPARTPGQPARGDAGELYLGNYRVARLKVEGESAKAAWVALQQFIID